MIRSSGKLAPRRPTPGAKPVHRAPPQIQRTEVPYALCRFPTEIISVILQQYSSPHHFYLARLVSQQWADAVSGWHSLDLSGPDVALRVNDGILRTLLQKLPRLVRLNCAGCSRLSDYVCLFVGQHLGTSLRHLNLRYCNKLVGHGLMHLSQYCPNLEELDLSFDAKLEEFALRVLPLVRLKKCSLAGVLLLNSDVLESLAPSIGASLETFDLSHTNVTGRVLSTLAQHCPTLRRLELRGCLRLDDAGIQTMKTPWPSLEDLNLAQCDKLVDSSLEHIAQMLPGLGSLTLDGCVRLGDASLRALGLYCRRLVQLSLRYLPLVTDEGIDAAGREFRILHLDGCTRVTDGVLQKLGAASPALSLVTVLLCPQVTTSGIEALHESRPTVNAQRSHNQTC
ncbi:putative F-box/LRR-repeat protein 20 [Paratrimastix pyriformis]|uniref:F-box/LRR-repeat protein 20 n=1 Tax=Paratrimastix pyriformis TaxID=342808 RepID=A0ABQ8UUL0_9EUKA|nr:putative F-box/LRR-repeat protein 20 [Paratrimastix pyriformis]